MAVSIRCNASGCLGDSKQLCYLKFSPSTFSEGLPNVERKGAVDGERTIRLARLGVRTVW